jgi:hypothetical protein
LGLRGGGGEKLTGTRRKLNNKELYNLCSSPDIAKVIKSKRVIWEVHAVIVPRREMGNAHKILVGKSEE